jgi:2-isopropylmalate synthase
MSEERVRIFDTTLRDGEQSPGATLDTQEPRSKSPHPASPAWCGHYRSGFPSCFARRPRSGQAKVARRGRYGEDGPIDGGSVPAPIRATSTRLGRGFARKKPRIHTFIATSDIHLEHKLRMTREASDLAQDPRDGRHARQLLRRRRVQRRRRQPHRSGFSVRGAFAAAVEAGATTLNMPGYGGLYPTRGVPRVDRGMFRTSRATSISASSRCTVTTIWDSRPPTRWRDCRPGARQAECTINGIGERAGNASLEEIVMALHTRRDLSTTSRTEYRHHPPGAHESSGLHPHRDQRPAEQGGGRCQRFRPRSRHSSGRRDQVRHVRNHDAGDGGTCPEQPGARQALGPARPAHAARRDGFRAPSTTRMLDRIFERFKAVGRRKQRSHRSRTGSHCSATRCIKPDDLFVLHGVHVSCGVPSIPTASVSITGPTGEYETLAATGTGPVDAIFTAINRICGWTVELREYVVHAVSGGVDALGEVTVRIRSDR